jgi:DNA-binding transcriptional MerR regulator
LRYYDKLGFFNTVIDEDNRYRFFLSEADFFVIQKILSLKLIEKYVSPQSNEGIMYKELCMQRDG